MKSSANIEMNDVRSAFKKIPRISHRVYYESYDNYPTESSGLMRSHFKGIASYNNKLIFTHSNLALEDGIVGSDGPGKIMIADKLTSGYQADINAVYDTNPYHQGWSHPCSAQACGSFMAMGIQNVADATSSEIHILDLSPLDTGAQPQSIATIMFAEQSGGQSKPSPVNGVAMTKEHGDNGKYIVAGLQGHSLTIYRSVNSYLTDKPADNIFNVVGDTIQDFPQSGAGIALITQTDGSIYIISLDSHDIGDNNSIYLCQLTITDSTVSCSGVLDSKYLPVSGLSEAVRYATNGWVITSIMTQDPICGAFLTAFSSGAQDINILNSSFRWGKGLAITSADDIEIYATDRNDLMTSKFSKPVDTKKDFSLVTWATSSRWSGDYLVPSTGMSGSPSAVVFNNKIYCFHAGNGDSGSLWYNVFDGTEWSGDVNVHNTGMSGNPSAVVFNNKIYCFHAGGGDRGSLWYNVFDGTNWSGDVNVPNTGMSGNPSAVVFNNKIYCFHAGGGDSSSLWYNVFDGTEWSGDVNVHNTGMSGSPSVVVFNNKIYCFHAGGGDMGSLWYNVFDGTNWSGDVNVPNTGMSGNPSAVVFNNKIYCFHAGGGDSSSLWYNVFDGTEWSGDVNVPNTGMSGSPSVVVFNNKIHCFHAGGVDSSCLWYYVFNN